ncbi:fibrillarin-like rRNA/tRNA 2'-O-methyltransferase [Candidatus Woesearchaeota archaeon]|nr:fibrillarin-like rRNA/tRNA 2'-O-methyltransferase [Candidatus Woesearchaeota archaeon]
MRLKSHKFKGVYTDGKKLFTKSIAPKERPFEERIIKSDGDIYRQWDARKSKLAAAILKGVKETGIKPGQTVLYLGASHGYTPSFVSDIVGEKGFVFALDFAPRVVRDLVFVCEKRSNICPIMADANNPDSYAFQISEADHIYQDIAQKNQSEIFLKNVAMYLKKGGLAMIAVKSRSIDVSKKPKAVFDQVRRELEKEMEILDFRVLDPYEKDHCVFVCRKD